MAAKKEKSIGEALHWSYASLAMSHAALDDGALQFKRHHFMVRSRLYAGLRNGTLNIGALADDERLKLKLPQACAYCGSDERLTVDHLIPKKKGGPDVGDNMVWACASCNSSKGARDVLEWLALRGQKPSVLLLRRYLKIAIAYCEEHSLLEHPESFDGELPFSLAALRGPRPELAEMVLWVAARPSASAD